MRTLYLCLLSLVVFAIGTSAQELPVPEALKTVPNAKCYWSYSVERLSSKPNNSFSYSIRVGIAQVDSTGLPAGSLRLKHVVVYCRFTDKLKSRKVYCTPLGYSWVANFKIHTSKPLPVKIIATYRGQEQVMTLTLNKGVYPGENDDAAEEVSVK